MKHDVIRSTVRLLLLPLFVLAAALPAQKATETEVAKAARPAPVSAEARSALRQARALADLVKGSRDAERLQKLEAAARAYEEVAARFDGEPGGSAAAHFAAGDLWRRHGSLALAERHYLEAADRDPVRYGQRGTLAAADMQRRQKVLDKAMETYRKVVSMQPGTSRAQTARLWVARLQQQAGQLDQAIESFRSALEAAETSRQVIAAANWLAKALIAKGDLSGAEAAIAHAERHVADQEPEGEDADRLRKALDRMSARRALQRAKDKAQGAAKDAIQLERDRDKSGAGKGV